MWLYLYLAGLGLGLMSIPVMKAYYKASGKYWDSMNSPYIYLPSTDLFVMSMLFWPLIVPLVGGYHLLYNLSDKIMTRLVENKKHKELRQEYKSQEMIDAEKEVEHLLSDK